MYTCVCVCVCVCACACACGRVHVCVYVHVCVGGSPRLWTSALVCAEIEMSLYHRVSIQSIQISKHIFSLSLSKSITFLCTSGSPDSAAQRHFLCQPLGRLEKRVGACAGHQRNLSLRSPCNVPSNICRTVFVVEIGSKCELQHGNSMYKLFLLPWLHCR